MVNGASGIFKKISFGINWVQVDTLKTDGGRIEMAQQLSKPEFNFLVLGAFEPDIPTA